MSADEHLSPHQFPEHMAALKALAISKRHAAYPETPRSEGKYFHGTAVAFPEGSKLTAGHTSNYPGLTQDVNAQHVFVTPDISEAYHHGSNAAARMSDGDSHYGAIPQAHVYEAHPTGKITRDPEVDREDWASGGSGSSFQSRQPVKVGREVSRGAKAEYIDSMGSDWQDRSSW